MRGVWGPPAGCASAERLWHERRIKKGEGAEMRITMILACLLLAAPARAAEPLRIGLLRTLSPAPLYLAMERGYFAAEGLDAQFRFFESAQPIAAAAVSGDIDVGITALTGGFFSLASRARHPEGDRWRAARGAGLPGHRHPGVGPRHGRRPA